MRRAGRIISAGWPWRPPAAIPGPILAARRDGRRLGEVRQYARHGTAQQRLAHGPFATGIERLEKLDLGAAQEGERQAVAVKKPVSGERGELRPRRQD